MPGNTNKRYLAGLRARAVRLCHEVRLDYVGDWSAMARVAGLVGVLTPETVRRWVR